jgi:hypothetical protein
MEVLFVFWAVCGTITAIGMYTSRNLGEET